MTYPNRPPNINHIDQLLLEFLCETQQTQTKTLAEQSSVLTQLQVSNARIEQKLDSLAPLKERVSSLESDRTRARTAITLGWGACGVAGTVIMAIAGWLFAK